MSAFSILIDYLDPVSIVERASKLRKASTKNDIGSIKKGFSGLSKKSAKEGGVTGSVAMVYYDYSIKINL